jgi:hypothetical protein
MPEDMRALMQLRCDIIYIAEEKCSMRRAERSLLLRVAE